MLISQRLKLGFIHIPKNAGTSMTEWLMSTGLFEEIGNKHDSIHHVSESLKQSLEWFTIVRNPWQRLASHFKSHKKIYDSRMQWPRGSLKEKFYKPHKQLLKGFEHYCTSTQQFADPMIKWYDYRWTPQVCWIDQTVKIIRYENIDKDILWLRKKCRIKHRPFPHENKTNVKQRLNWTPKVMEMCYRHFAPDIERWNYKF